MKQKQHSTEEIIRILRQAETDVTIDSVCREHNCDDLPDLPHGG